MIWLEPRVRQWWLLGALILILFVAFLGDRLWARVLEQRLLTNGIVLRAKITGAENKTFNHPVGPDDVVQLQFTYPDKTQDSFVGHINGTGIVGGDITVRVDPSDHSNWSDRTEPTPMLDSLFVGLLLLPLIPAMIAAAYVQARALRNTWQLGTAVEATIFDRRQSPIAPMSYALRCSVPNSRKKDLFTVYVPRLRLGLEKGNLIWIVNPIRKGHRLAVLWMAGKSA